MILTVVIAACSQSAGTTTSPPTSPPVTSSTTSTTVPVRGGPIPVCATEDPLFAADGNIGTVGTSVSDAATLTALRWFTTQECDRIDVSFSSAAGAPALDPPTAAGVLLRQLGVIRVSLGTTVTGSGITDQLIDSAFVSRAFVGRDASGALFVDLHLKAAAEARLTFQTAPALLSIDLRAGGENYPSRPIVSGDIVLLDPIGGSIQAPIVVSGYHRGTGGLVATLDTSDGSRMTAETTAGVDQLWSSYTFLFPSPSPGPATLLVGNEVGTSLVINP